MLDLFCAVLAVGVVAEDEDFARVREHDGVDGAAAHLRNAFLFFNFVQFFVRLHVLDLLDDLELFLVTYELVFALVLSSALALKEVHLMKRKAHKQLCLFNFELLIELWDSCANWKRQRIHVTSSTQNILT